MRVGITVSMQFSFFSGGGATTAISIAELCKKLGHDVWLVNTNGTQQWWEDMQTLSKEYTQVLHTCTLSESTNKKPLDIVLEVSGTLDPSVRKLVADRAVWIVRKPILLHDTENSIFPLVLAKRDLTGLSAIWALDTEITKDEVEYLQILGRGLDVVVVPTVWSPKHLETHKKDMNLPEWIHMLALFVQQKNALPAWSVHIAETNTSASSSCTIPLVALREIKRLNEVPLAHYKIHNADHIKNSEFFLTNVFKHCQIQDLSGEFMGRQRLLDWIFDPASVIFSHSRFRPLRPFYLDALWAGIPLVHNSTLLKDIGPYYYSDNSIVEATGIFKKLHTDLLGGQGMFQQGKTESIRELLKQRFGPEAHVSAWNAAFQLLLNTTIKESSQKSIPLIPIISTSTSTSKPEIAEKILHVLFTDMWTDFNPSYNMFLLMIQESLSHAITPITLRVQGYSSTTLPKGITPSLLIFGPFGTEWTKWGSVQKIHFTGENTAPNQDPTVCLNLGYPHAEFVDEKYIRCPLWMLEIDWFGARTDLLQNPKPLPIDRCTQVFPDEIAARKKFCAFVVTNPCNPLRNNSFHWLSSYKQVDSAGRLFNTVGDTIFAGLGGGGGELAKHEFLKQYKFCLAFENASSQGYTTEKLLHAKAAGCIPIYWGDPKVERDFDPSGFIDARGITTSEQLIDLVKKIDEDSSAYLRMMSVPPLDSYKRDLVRRTLAEISFSMLKASTLLSASELASLPKFIGATSTKEATELGAKRNLDVQSIVTITKEKHETPIKNPLIITYASQNYLSSLQQLLAGLTIQKKGIPDLEVRVWLTSDVPPESRALLTKNYSDFTFYSPPQNEVPVGFSDFWEPQHFAWKLWLYNHVNSDPSLQGRLVMYLDSGVFCSRWPSEWLRKANTEGVCVLQDSRQTNDDWCHDVFKQKLQMTEDDKQAKQIVAGILAFRAGSSQANALFSQAYTLAKQRDIITGEKWSGVRNGKPFGHRHDQSILSVLSHRLRLATYPLDELYCQVSLRKTFISGKSFYVHRGRFFIHKPFAQNIDDVYIINLDRRKDRMEKLFANHPELELDSERISAVEGTKLQLTPTIARLFKPHDFNWKKAIMGCALSHLGLWWRLANEKPEINNYLILEDDVKFAKGWKEHWSEAARHLPQDYDIIYLGGILPPNRDAFEMNKEKVNPYFSRVKPNMFFGQPEPTRYYHSCAYAYVLSKQGAEKVLKLMNLHDGYWTSADHMLCNHVESMNLYFLDPLVAGCYQDEDPSYQRSAFNDFNRIENYDSDLRNNLERFSEEEVQRCASDLPLQIKEALLEVAEQQLSLKYPEEALAYKEEQKPLNFITGSPLERTKRFVCLDTHTLKSSDLFEAKWLEELFGKSIPLQIDSISLDSKPTDTPIVIVQKNHFDSYLRLLSKWSSEGLDYYILHLSDEFANDPVAFYSDAHCLGIFRFYDRPDLSSEVRTKTIILPLGYHYTLSNGSDNPGEKTPRLPFRNLRWSFLGTNWRQRDEHLRPFEAIEPHRKLLVDSWESKEKIERQQYLSVLLDTYFVPCLPGNNNETFRVYEALECGCIPLYVKQDEKDLHADFLMNEIGIMPSSSWEEAAKLMQHLLGNLPLLENYRTMILNRWIALKKKRADSIKQLLNRT